MSKLRLFAKYWLPVVLWMIVIFSASGDAQSFNRSSRIIGPLVRLLFPNLADESVDAIVTIVRKCAHLAEYAILAFLVWRAFRKPTRRDPRPWSWRHAGFAVAWVAVYAATDEFHQSTVPGRHGSPKDVLIDTIGGLLGLVAIWGFVEWRRRRREKPAITTVEH